MNTTSFTVLPYETISQIAGSFPGCNLWVTIPYAATDACVAAIARRVRDNFPKGRKVYVEYGNELWSYVPSTFYLQVMASLGAWSAPSGYLESGVVRAASAHSIFISTFNDEDINGNTNRGGEIVRLFGGQYADAPSNTYAVLSYAQTNNFQVDVITGSYYLDIPEDTTTEIVGGLLATHWPTSPQYKASNPWTRATYLDFYRHFVLYNAQNVAVMTDYQAACNDYAEATGFPAPLIAAYEASIQGVTPFNLLNCARSSP